MKENRLTRKHMKKITIFNIALLSLLVSACEFNQSANKDLATGAYSRGNGLGCEGPVIEINGKAENRNTFVYGEKVNFIFNDISGLKKVEDKTFPGLSMYIVQNEKDTVLSYPDLLEDLKDGTPLSPLQLQANFISALPFRNNEEYKVYVHIWDRKGEGKFSYELPFTVEESKLLDIRSKDINYSTIYLWNESLKQPLFSKNVSSDNTLMLILEGLDGLENIEGKVYPILSIDLIDSKGNKIISNANLLDEYENEGIDAEKFAQTQLPVTLTFSKGTINNPCKLSATLKDKNSEKRIDIKTELEII